MTRITIIGAGGRMGCTLVRCIARADDLELAGATEWEGADVLKQDAGMVAGCGPLDVMIGVDLSAALQTADVAIDFSAREALADNLQIATQQKVPLVIGTTGLDDAMLAAVAKAAKQIPIVQAANMSTGINVLLELLTQAAGILGFDYDVEVVETHHRHKKDAPSGTALMLAEAVAVGREQNLREVMVHGRSGMVGERPAGEIGMHALRGGDVVGEHTVHFAAEGEKLEFTHRASNREAFALGALRAARWLTNQTAGCYDMRDVLGLRTPSCEP